MYTKLKVTSISFSFGDDKVLVEMNQQGQMLISMNGVRRSAIDARMQRTAQIYPFLKRELDAFLKKVGIGCDKVYFLLFVDMLFTMYNSEFDASRCTFKVTT